MIMHILKYTESECTNIRHIDTAVKPEETMRISRPSRLRDIIGIVKVSLGDWIFGDSSEDVIMELFDIHDYDTAHNGMNKVSSVDRCGEMFGGKYRFQIMRIYHGVVATPLFRVDIPLSSHSIWFATKLSRAETNDHVESREKL
jgi:hypothetical protein